MSDHSEREFGFSASPAGLARYKSLDLQPGLGFFLEFVIMSFAEGKGFKGL